MKISMDLYAIINVFYSAVSDVDALDSFDGVADILQSSPESISRTVYQRACARLQLVPSRHVYCRLEQTEIHLPNCFLGAREVKAIAIALVVRSIMIF